MVTIPWQGNTSVYFIKLGWLISMWSIKEDVFLVILVGVLTICVRLNWSFMLRYLRHFVSSKDIRFMFISPAIKTGPSHVDLT